MIENAPPRGARRSAFVSTFLSFVLLTAAQALAQQGEPRVADPAVWGIYAQLVGNRWNGTMGPAEWQWASDDTILEKRQAFKDQIIHRGANPGELVAYYGSGLGAATYDGRIAADGSVLWIRRGLIKTPMRASIVDGRYREELVKLDDAGQIVKVRSTGWYDRTGGAPIVASTAAEKPSTAEQGKSVATSAAVPAATPVVPATAPVVAASTPAVAATPPPVAVVAPPPPASIRDFERFVGKHLYSKDRGEFLDIVRGGDGSLSIQTRLLDGHVNWRYVLAESKKKPGKWELVEAPREHRFYRTAEWPADNKLEVSAKDGRLGGWFHNLDLIADGGIVKARSYGHMVNSIGLFTGHEYDWTYEYAVISDAAVAQLHAEMREAQRRKAAFEASQPKKTEAEIYAERMAVLAELAQDTDSYEAEIYAEQYGLPYTPPRREAPGVSPAFQALLDANAAASASEARSRAALDATLEQAARQAAYERDLAERRRMDEENARRAEDARRAREATERQYEIARQHEARQEAQRQARAQAERDAAAARSQQPVNTGATRPMTATVAEQRCEMIHPNYNDTYNTVKGEEFGKKYLRDRAEASCLSRTGNSGIDGDATCTADGPHVSKCKILVKCVGTMRSPSCASNAQ
jgi:hypothetical protein